MCLAVCSQASFVASGNRTDISLDDPNFWDKWAKKADIDMETVNGRVRAAARTPPPFRPPVLV